MSTKPYWNLLVLFCVLCQGVIGTFSEKDIDVSSDLLVRQKRVINRNPGGDVRVPIKNSPYTVVVKELRVQDYCAGVILTRHIALTVAKCVEEQVSNYRVYSGCAHHSRKGNRNIHHVTDKKINTGNHPFRSADGIALITVAPPFVYSLNTKNIVLYEGQIQPGSLGVISGWGCNAGENPGTEYPDRLRSITVPIISNHDCAMLYLRNFAISDSDICTFDATEHQYCAVGDAGAPLVLREGTSIKLAGVHLWNGGVIGRCNPDVFVNLQYPTYKTWIAETIQSLEEHINNLNQIQHSSRIQQNQPRL